MNECGRFYALPEFADYRFCYLPKGHEGPCVFESRRREGTSPFDTPGFEKVERGIDGPWERAADRAEELALAKTGHGGESADLTHTPRPSERGESGTAGASTAACAFSDALLALRELGHVDVAERLRDRWFDVETVP